MASVAAWTPCILISGIGFLLLALTYGARVASKRSGKYVSGTPCFGGLLIALGFLLSPCKWLALLGLLDYGFWELGLSFWKHRGK